MKDLDKRLDYSGKFMQMGQALMQEGYLTNDNTISLMGTIMIFMGGIMLDDGDVYKFSELVSMFSAKKLIDTLEEENSPIFDLIKGQPDDETYEDLIKKIELIRKNNKKDEDNEE